MIILALVTALFVALDLAVLLDGRGRRGVLPDTHLDSSPHGDLRF
ncbi:hypothetical protein [Rhodococcus sp. HNM0569]|nr:hypothetical protein [Rhodococcus sp. HNM0569]